MSIERYRIKNATIALCRQDGTYVARTVPAGTILEVHSLTAAAENLLPVVWNGDNVMMFARDLRLRAERVDGQDPD